MTDIKDDVEDNELVKKFRALAKDYSDYYVNHTTSDSDVVITGGGGGGGGTGISYGWSTMPSPVVMTTAGTAGSSLPSTITVSSLPGTITVGGTGSTTTTVNNSGLIWGGAGWTGPTGTFGRGVGSNFQMPKTTSITVGPKFKITAPTDGNTGPVEIECNGHKLDVGELVSMVSVFKVLLKTVATDKEFCERHPEITDMAHAYLLEELKR